MFPTQLLGKEEEGSEESSEEESSEYSEETDSEEEGPRLKPVFVRKKDRVTIHQKEQQQLKVKQVSLIRYVLPHHHHMETGSHSVFLQ